MEKSEFNQKDNESSLEKIDDKLEEKSKENLETLQKIEEPIKVNTETDQNIENQPIKKDDSLFRRVLENGFDGITTNPNYKLLALLIILLINLSLFFVIGNIGKNFLRNSGILS